MIKSIILETKDQSRIWSNKGRRIHFDQANFNDIDDEIRYHIILVDTEAEIVEGELFLFNRKEIHIANNNTVDICGTNNIDKIISSTNKSHLANFEGYEKYTARKISAKVYLPRPSPQSIQLLINYYNEHKCMPESVEVETKEQLSEALHEALHNPEPLSFKQVFKLNQQGEIDIAIPEVEKWDSQEKVNKLIKKFYSVFDDNGYAKNPSWDNEVI